MKPILAILLVFYFSSCSTEQQPSEPKFEKLETAKEVIERQEPKQSTPIDTNGLYAVSLYDNSENGFDTFISLEYLEQEIYLYNGFNYPQLKHDFYSDSLHILSNENWRIEIREGQFDSSEVELGFDSTNKWLQKINGKDFYGTDGNIPRTKIKEIKIISVNSFVLPKEAIEDLYEPNLHCYDSPELHCLVEAFQRNENEIILVMSNSDGAGGYYVMFSIVGDSLNKRIVGLGF